MKANYARKGRNVERRTKSAYNHNRTTESEKGAGPMSDGRWPFASSQETAEQKTEESSKKAYAPTAKQFSNLLPGPGEYLIPTTFGNTPHYDLQTRARNS
jgi:hypothetical protein